MAKTHRVTARANPTRAARIHPVVPQTVHPVVPQTVHPANRTVVVVAVVVVHPRHRHQAVVRKPVRFRRVHLHQPHSPDHSIDVSTTTNRYNLIRLRNVPATQSPSWCRIFGQRPARASYHTRTINQPFTPTYDKCECCACRDRMLMLYNGFSWNAKIFLNCSFEKPASFPERRLKCNSISRPSCILARTTSFSSTLLT